jgi:hypothetical protein
MRLASTSDRTVHVFFLRSEDSALELEKLNFLALGARATEVLYWLAKGKTNEEIGIILGVPTGNCENASQKHLFSFAGREQSNSCFDDFRASRAHLEKCCLLIARKVHPDGIRFEGLHYVDTTLAAHVEESVTLRYNPRDMAEIRVFCQERFVCRAICPELVGETVPLREILRSRNRRR